MKQVKHRFDHRYYQETETGQERETAELQVTEILAEKEGTYWIRLDQQPFFPGGGGTPKDHVRFLNVDLLDFLEEDDGSIKYCIKGQIAEGQKIHYVLDLKARHDLMQQHSGEHVLSGLAHQYFACENVGFHLDDEKMTLDFDRELNTAELEQLERAANEVVFQNLPIKIWVGDVAEAPFDSWRSKLDLDASVRLIEIPGVDVCACCALHCLSTGQIGGIRILTAQKHRGGMRLEAACGQRLMRYSQRQEAVLRRLGQHLSKPEEALETRVLELLEQNQSLKYKLEALRVQAAFEQLLHFENSAHTFLLLTQDWQDLSKKNLLKKIEAASLDLSLCFLCSKAGPGLQISAQVFASNEDLAEKSRGILQDLKAQAYFKGGGSSDSIQGFIQDAADFDRWMKETLDKVHTVDLSDWS